MRIIAGQSKGRKLTSFQDENIRPTSDKMRGALFNSLKSQFGTLEGILFVDAFAGTGAVGLEALSRGAEAVIFFETAADAVKLLRKNLEKADFLERALLYGDVLNPPRYTRPADVVFLDPPYKCGLVPHAMKKLHENGYIGQNTVIVAETDKTEDVPCVDVFTLSKKNAYGKGALHWISCSNSFHE